MQPSPTPKVLIVDDNRTTVEMLKRLFEFNQFTALMAYSGREALTIARSEQPDLILLDVMMPEMNGFEVLQALRQDPLTEGIPTIFLTAKDSPADVEHGIQLGADDYLPKPAEGRELIARARSKVEAKRYRDALARKTRDLQQLLDLSTHLNVQLDLPNMMRHVLEAVLKLRQTVGAALLYQTDTGLNYQFAVRDDQSDRDSLLSQANLEHALNQMISTNTFAVEVSKIESQIVSGYALCSDVKIHGALFILSEASTLDDLAMLYESAAQQSALALSNASSFQLRQNYARELEQTVNKRTEELKNAQQLLIRSEKLASVGRLAGAIAHEINNPLMPIVLNLELMVEDLQQGNPIQLTDVDILVTYQHAVRIKRTLERVLQFTRNGREGKSPMHPVNINKLLENLITLSKHFFAQSAVEILASFDDNVKQIQGNSDQLEQVFLNMMINARDAMPEGGKLYISTKARPKHVIISIRDTGVGIPPEFLQRMFEPFASNREKGTGLGLFISHEIITNHQGTISVQSELNVGTEFIIELPANS
jgi:two-component system cell cycle sensor histidine kinase/response regulator CckA